jgi:hypothetical protein
MGMLRKVAFRPTCGEDGVEPKGEQQGDGLSDGGDGPSAQSEQSGQSA